MGPQAQRSVRPPRCICRRGKDVRGRKFALGPGAALSDRREFAEPGSGFSKFSASYSLFPSETAPWGRTLRCDWGSYPPVLFKRKFPVPITLPVLSRRHPGEFSESRGKIMRILKSHIISNLRDRVICVRQLGHSAVHFGFQDELLQCHPGALVEEGGEVFVVVSEITGEFGDFEGLAAVVLDVADDVLQDLCPLRFGSVGAVEGALAVDFAENSGSQAVVEERVVETQGSVLELLHEDDDAVRGRKRSLARDA